MSNRKKQKTVLIVATTFPRWAGDRGPARFVFDLARTLSARLKVIVLAPHHRGAAMEESIEGVHVHRFIYFLPARMQRLCDGGGIMPNLQRSWLDKAQVVPLFAAMHLSLKRLLATVPVDIVNSHWIIPSGLITAFNRLTSVPHLLTVHSTDVHLLSNLPAGKSIASFVARRSNKILITNRFLRDKLQHMVSRPLDADVVPMGVDFSVFKPNPPKPELVDKHRLRGKKTILYVGKLIPVKGVDHLLGAVRSLPADRRDLKLLIVGDGSLRGELQASANRPELRDRVEFIGRVGHELLVDYYNLADLVVVPSIMTDDGYTEGLPVVALEALACGKPIIASRVGGLPDIITDNLNGLLVPPGNERALADAMDRLIEGDGAGPATIRESATRYSWQSIGDIYAATLESMIS
ncbi:glycosyltransferase [candidate division KSB1 bacterium]